VAVFGGRAVRRTQACFDFALHAVNVIVEAAWVTGDAARSHFDHLRRDTMHEVAIVAGEDDCAAVIAKRFG